MQIRDGQVSESKELALYCGYNTYGAIKDVYSTGRYMWVKFHSNSTVNNWYLSKGFKAHFDAVDLRKYYALTAINQADFRPLSYFLYIIIKSGQQIVGYKLAFSIPSLSFSVCRCVACGQPEQVMAHMRVHIHVLGSLVPSSITVACTGLLYRPLPSTLLFFLSICFIIYLLCLILSLWVFFHYFPLKLLFSVTGA